MICHSYRCLLSDCRRGCKGQCASACLSQTLLTSEVQSSEARRQGTSADPSSTPTRPPRLEAPFMTHMPRCSFLPSANVDLWSTHACQTLQASSCCGHYRLKQSIIVKEVNIGGVAWIWQGDITSSSFQSNTAPKGKAIFRTQSEGDVTNNKKLDADTQVTIDNPTEGT